MGPCVRWDDLLRGVRHKLTAIGVISGRFGGFEGQIARTDRIDRQTDCCIRGPHLA